MLILASILGISVAVIISRLIIKPLNALMEGIDAVSEGNYSMRVKVSGSGELLKLGETFNRMASTVQETVKENLERNKILDEKLQELWEIYELTRSMSFSLQLNEILSVFLEKAQTLSFSSYGQIILKHKHTKKPMVMVRSQKDACVNAKDFERGLSKCFLDSKLIEVQSGDYAMIFFPLLSGSNVQGVLYLAKKEKSGYTDNVKRFLETITPVAASMIENGRLYSQVAEINEYMKNVLGSVNTGVATLNRKNQFTTANKAFHEILKISGTDIVDLRIDELAEKLSDQVFAAKFKEIAAQQAFQKSKPDTLSVERFQLIFNETDGSIHTLEMRVIPLAEGEEIIGSVVVIEDITDLKKIEQQMLESEKWAVLGKLAASVAHEIRNPLVAIRSLVEIIGGEVEGEFKEHVSVVLGEVHRLNRVVAELLSLVRPESTSLKETDLTKLLNEINLLIRHESQKKGIKLEIDIPDNFKTIKVDAEKIKQAFLNVLLNAIQALTNGGKIYVKVYEIEPDKVGIKFQDDGPGIKEDIRENIFTPFFTTKDNGTGLGLAITRKIAELHGGRIQLECPQDGGTCFNFILPTGGTKTNA
jgi:PAS domain S-box-containing protein